MWQVAWQRGRGYELLVFKDKTFRQHVLFRTEGLLWKAYLGTGQRFGLLFDAWENLMVYNDESMKYIVTIPLTDEQAHTIHPEFVDKGAHNDRN